MTTNTIEIARAAFPEWRSKSVSERVQLLSSLRDQIVQNVDLIMKTVGEETHKPPIETLINEIVPTLAAAKYYEKTAFSVLKVEKRPGGFLFPKSKFYVEYHPRGVVLVLAPFNFPFQLALVPVLTALVAGNTVVCKVSEITPDMAPLFTDLFQRAGFPSGVVQFENGDSEVGENLVKAKPDLVFLTGGVATGKRVMSLASQNLTPVILELGGKDPMVVFSDAPFERTVSAAVYGAFANAGQVCVSVERVYVQRPLVDDFISAVAQKTKMLRTDGEDTDVGPLISVAQANRFKGLIDDALAKGAKLHTALEIKERTVSPVVLSGVTADMRLMQEEIFGPAMPIISFDTEEEAIKLANDSPFGLNASVWTADLEKGRRVASRMEAGNVVINDVLKNIGNPHLPFGGIKSSGLGIYHGPEGLRAFCRPLSLTVNSGHWKQEPNWFPYTLKKRHEIEMMIAFLYAGGSFLKRLKSFRALRKGFKGEMKSNDER